MVVAKSKSRAAYVVLGCLFALYVVILLIVKVNQPEFSIGRLMAYLGIGSVVVGGLAYSAYYLTHGSSAKKKEDGDQPAPITFAQARAIALEALADPLYSEELDLTNLLDEGTEALGEKIKSEIYFIHGHSKFSMDKRIAVILNMHYPFTKRRILISPEQHQLTLAKQKLVSFPERSPDVEETITENPILGTKQVQKKIIHQKESQETKKEDDLGKQ